MTNEPYNQLTCQPLSPNKPQIAPHLPLLTPAPKCRPNTPPAQPGPTNGSTNPPMRRPGRLIRPRYCGEHLGPTTTRTARTETPPVGFGRASGRTFRAKRGCEVSRAARHEGAHDPGKQPHHHQKQRPSGGTAPVTGRCTRSGALHPFRRGALPTDRVQCPGTQEQTRNWQTEPLPATTSPSTGHKVNTGRVLSSFVAPSTHTVPERTKQPRPRPTGIGDEAGAG